MTHPDRHPLGTLANHEGQPETPFIDCDSLDLTGVSVLRPSQVRMLEKALADYWNRLASLRLRDLDPGIDAGLCREDIAELMQYPRLPALESVDWVEVGRRLTMAGPYLGELRRLHALLTADETTAEAAA